MLESEFRVIPEFPDYGITRSGIVKRIRDAKTAKAGWILRQSKLKTGYAFLHLRRDGKSISQYVHCLVLMAFVGPRPTPQHQAAHINGIRDDNRLENLRWATPAENSADKKRHGTDQQGMKHHLRKITDKDVKEIRRLRKNGVYCKDVAKKYGVHPGYVSLVANGKRWSHL